MAYNNIDNEERNYYCLTKLLLVEGVRLVRACVECNLRDGMDIYQALIEKRGRMEKLMKNKAINAVQLQILYPKHSARPDLSKVDMTLWCVLARNITVSKLRDSQWNYSPEPMDQSWEYDILRLRYIRNEIAHLSSPAVDDVTFNIYWLRLKEALQGLENEVELDERVDFVRYREMAWSREELKLLQFQLKEEMLTESMSVLAQEREVARRQFQVLLAFLGLVLLGCLTIALLYIFKPKTIMCEDQIDFIQCGNVGVMKFLSKTAWGGSPPKYPINPLHRPVDYAIISHTAYVGLCSTTQLCCAEVKYIEQLFKYQKNYSDIPFHYLIDVNGIVFEGRSHAFWSAAVADWNNRTISIAFMGNFQWQHPSDSSMAALETLLAYLEDSPEGRILAKNYTLYGACEVRPSVSPGVNLYKQLVKFKHFRHRDYEVNSTYCDGILTQNVSNDVD